MVIGITGARLKSAQSACRTPRNSKESQSTSGKSGGNHATPPSHRCGAAPRRDADRWDDAREECDRYSFDQLENEGSTHATREHEGLVTPRRGSWIDRPERAPFITFRDPEMWKARWRPQDVLLEDCDAVLTESRCCSVCTDHYARGSTARHHRIVVSTARCSSARDHAQCTHASGVSSEPLQETASGERRGAALRRSQNHDVLWPAPAGGCTHGTIWLDEHGCAAGDARLPGPTVDTSAQATSSTAPFTLAINEKRRIREALRSPRTQTAALKTRCGGARCPQRLEVKSFLTEGRDHLVSSSPQTACNRRFFLYMRITLNMELSA